MALSRYYMQSGAINEAMSDIVITTFGNFYLDDIAPQDTDAHSNRSTPRSTLAIAKAAQPP